MTFSCGNGASVSDHRIIRLKDLLLRTPYTSFPSRGW
ncbi:hypothetical protein FHW69_003191 [Luteibacter sp. Sphag1AF]|nr:hypothetical protein [Luteibacter sp. Sphag1AF]